MNRVLLVLLALLTGCGAGEADRERELYWDETLTPYIEEFVEQLSARGVYREKRDRLPVGVTFAELEGTVAGRCDFESATVKIDPAYAYAASGVLRSIVAHELVHCVYFIEHHDAVPGHVFSTNLSPDVGSWDAERWGKEWDRLAELSQ